MNLVFLIDVLAPAKEIYSVHIKNLPPNVDGDMLANKFHWLLGYMLFNSSTDDQSLTTECWLKGIQDRKIAEDFVDKWNGEKVVGKKIICEIEDDQLELCAKFRLGQCLNTNQSCYWEHIKCTAKETCSDDCPYGHVKGVKTGSIYSKFYHSMYSFDEIFLHF